MSINIVKYPTLRSISFCTTVINRKAISQCLVDWKKPKPITADAVIKKELQAKSLQEILIYIIEMEISNTGSHQNRHRIWNSVFRKCQKLQKKHSKTKPRLAKLTLKQTLWDSAMCRTQITYKLIIVHYYMLKPADTMNSNSKCKEHLMSPFNPAALSLLILHQYIFSLGITV